MAMESMPKSRWSLAQQENPRVANARRRVVSQCGEVRPLCLNDPELEVLSD